MLSLLKKKQHGGRKAGAVVEQARTTVRGQHGFGGGAWGQLAQPRTWLETTWENAGMFPFVSGTSRPITGAPVGFDLTWARQSPLTISRSLNQGLSPRPQRWFLG